MAEEEKTKVEEKKAPEAEKKVAPKGVPSGAQEPVTQVPSGQMPSAEADKVGKEKIEEIPTIKEEAAPKEKEKDEKEEKKEEPKEKEKDKEKIVNAKDKVVEKLTDSVKDGKKLESYRTMGEPSNAKKSTSAVQKTEGKVKKGEKKEDVLERVYVVPMRRGFLKVPHYKRAKKAIKTMKEFLAKHMKVEDRDISKVKVDIYLNNEVWFKGIKRPLSKVKVKARKVDGIVYAELAEIPDAVKFKKQKDEKKKTKVDEKKMKKVVAQEAAEEKVKEGREDKADKTETREKEKATVEAGLEKNKDMAKAVKHTAKAKDAKMDKMSATTQRKALKK